VDIDGNNAFQIKAIGVVISTFETLPFGNIATPRLLQAHAVGVVGHRRRPVGEDAEDTDLSGYNGFCGSCSTPFIEPQTSKFSSQLSA
jgi:hypothetical protein